MEKEINNIIKQGLLKKASIVFILMCSLIGRVFAQENQEKVLYPYQESTQKQSILIDIFPAIEGAFEGNTGIGMFYERKINSYFSSLIEFNFYSNLSNDDLNYVIMAHGRVYPFKTTLGKSFYNIGIGYRSSEWEDNETTFLLLSLSAGWKFIVGRGFVIEPNVGFWANIMTLSGEPSVTHAPIIGINFGWAF